MSLRRTGAIMTAVAALLAGTASAADLGTYGQTFAIGETDIMEYLAAKLAAFQKSGKLDRLNREFAERAQKRIERPNPVPGIVRTQKPASWLFDPSIVVPEDLADTNGRVFARKGDNVNPLDHMVGGFPEKLIFIDGDDPPEVAMAMARRKADPQNVTVILVAGAPLEVMRKYKAPVFFDQEGSLTAHFGVRQVPAIVALDEKDHRKLRISEVKP